MGCGQSKQPLVDKTEGDGRDFLERYSVDRILGQGEFGVVKLIHEKAVGPNSSTTDGPALACKILRKGMVFKDNTLYSAIKPKVLKIECKILRALAGQHQTLRVRGIYESPSVIYLVTDYCAGGDMFHYVSDFYGESGLRTEDVSRISFQLFDALDHCARHGVLHRDIKPENIMFADAKKGAPLRLIDYGSGTISTDEEVKEESAPTESAQDDGSILSMFTTFAGSAFYISPEMFKRTYTVKTDVWSAGVTVYVLVAGYPSTDLQDAFNMLQDSTNPEDRIKLLKKLPNMPEMPDTFFEMLDKCLTYRHKKRNTATTILESDFIQFHKNLGKKKVEKKDETGQDAVVASPDGAEGKQEGGGILNAIFNVFRTESAVVQGAALRHKQMRNYLQYERGITAVVASVLKRDELGYLLDRIEELIAASPEKHTEVSSAEVTNKRRLQIVRVHELLDMLRELKYYQIVKMIEDQAHGENYNAYAYHVAILRQFYTYEEETSTKGTNFDLDTSINRRMTQKLKNVEARRDKRNLGANDHGEDPANDEQDEARIRSVHGNNVWDTIKKQMKPKPSLPKMASSPNLDALNMSSHV